MKKILSSIIAITFLAILSTLNAQAACIQCPEIQKLIKKEFKKEKIELSREQQKEIDKTKSSMKDLMKEFDKKQKTIQKEIDKILKDDCPDIAKMIELKTEKAKIQKDRIIARKEFYDNLLYIYTPEQQYTAKRVLSENSDIKIKKPCEFCNENHKLKLKCKKCNK